MWRVLAFLIAVAAFAVGLAYFAERPGSVSIAWLGYEIETSVFVGLMALVAAVAVLLLLWALLRFAITRPAAIARFWHDRRERRGLDALSRGLVAVGAGDKEEARRYAALARRAIPHAPLTALLRAQAAELEGDRATARRIYEGMTSQPDMQLLGLRGLYLEARRENEKEAALQFAARAAAAKPALPWSVEALFALQCEASDWEGALQTLEIGRRNRRIGRALAARRRAVLLTAQAQDAEDSDPEGAREKALQAHKLAPDLVPAAEIAGRLLAARGSVSHASRVIAKTWRLIAHPDLAQAYAFLRPGDSPRDRLRRARQLAQSAPPSLEAGLAVANAALDAQDWRAARAALEPHLEDRPPARLCLAMARIEQGEHGDRGRVREWLARAVRAPRDPAWVADGAIAERWAPVSPVTGKLDAFAWIVPPELERSDEEAAVLEDFVAEEPAPVLTSEPDAPSAADASAAHVEAPTEPGAPAAEPAPEPAAAVLAPTADGREPTEDKKTLARASEPRIFVPPRAPDDPGPEPEDIEPDSRPPGAAPFPPRP